MLLKRNLERHSHMLFRNLYKERRKSKNTCANHIIQKLKKKGQQNKPNGEEGSTKEKSQNYEKENDIIEKIKKAETLFSKNDNKKQVGGLLYFISRPIQRYCNQVCVVMAQRQAYRPMEKNRIQKQNTDTYMVNLFCTKMQIQIWRRIIFSINSAGTIAHSCKKLNLDPKTEPFTLHKN